MAVKYTRFDFEFPEGFTNESYEYVKLAYEDNGDFKILFLLDFVPTEDLNNGKMLSGETGDLLANILNCAQTFYLKKKVKYSWLACTFNACRTIGKPKQYQAQAREMFADRIKAIINRYKPNVVVSFGPQPTQALIPAKLELSHGVISHWLGVPIKTEVKSGKNSHKCLVVPSLSLNTLIRGSRENIALSGYVARNLANALTAELRHGIDVKQIEKHKCVLIDKVSKFDKLLDVLYDAKAVAVDTETKDLSRVTNKILTIQFAKCADYGYVVPLYHKDTPFMAKELKYISKRLREYFEGKNKNDYHIYANADFDLNVIRTEFECSFMANDVWDIFAGEFALDENMKFLKSVTGEYYYSVGNISTQYGFEGYLTATFGKADRSNIAKHDLDEDLLKYMSLDVVVPFAIHEKQKEKAKFLGHKKYESLVRKQISDTLHFFSLMETNGSGVDIKYLFHLKTPASPIEKVINDMTNELLNTQAAKKANRILAKKQGIPTKGLFGDTNAQVFSLKKDDHKRLLFFKVLKLKPLDSGKSGKGKLDRAFQKEYANVPEVTMYTELGKAKKLKTAYVNNFLKLLKSSNDFKHDHRIRAVYNYLKVLTGRTSANDPNLQNIPARSELGKHIKRLFIARKGHLYVKVDYRVHEVRGWANISFDKALAAVFAKAKKLRDKYRIYPSPELAKRLKAEADIHVMNAMYFFGLTLEQVDEKARDAVKSVIFGLIYQRSATSIATALGRAVEFTQNLINNFNKRFPSGMKWLEDTKKIARKQLFFENPLGIRRHLWGYLMPDSSASAKKVHAECDRRAVNSPIQGMGAQQMAIGARQLDKMIYRLFIKTKRRLSLFICNSVHDSLESEVAYEDLILGLDYIEKALTTKVQEEIKRRHGFDLVSPLEIDFEIGSSLSTVQKWDFSLEKLESIVYDSLIFQRDELGYDVDVEESMNAVFGKIFTDGPKWMRDQVNENPHLKRFKNYKFKLEKKVA